MVKQMKMITDGTVRPEEGILLEDVVVGIKSLPWICVLIDKLYIHLSGQNLEWESKDI